LSATLEEAELNAGGIASAADDGDARCFHCGLEAPAAVRETASVAGAERVFCCTGCKAVCQAIHAAGLEGFYRRTPDGEILGPPPALPKQLALYDLDEVQQEFVDSLADSREINLLVEGIHCAACVWLIENGLKAMPGIAEARVNLTGRRLRVKWDNGKLPLSAILRRLGELGYAALPFDPQVAEGSLQRQNRALLYRMAFAAFGMMNLMWISIALYSGADQGEFRDMFHWIGFAIATPTLLYSGYPFYRGAWVGLRRLSLSMDLPIAIGASITYLYSLYVTITGSGHVYWDTVVNFLFVILVGRYLEAISKRQAVSSTQRLLDLQPKVATVIRDGAEAVLPIRALREGDLMLVRPGETVPADGVVAEGESSIDESMLTGESRPVPRGTGDRVSAGTLNGAGVLQVRVSAVLRDSALGRIIKLVEDAQASKAPIQCMADRIVPWFVAVTLTLAALTFAFWVQQDFEKALMAATAVLIITCPCAFGLATPMAIAVASGLGAREGILIKNGAVFETLSDIDHYVLDKTGTVTEGRPAVTAVSDAFGQWYADSATAMDETRRRDLTAIAALERLSEHPLARAVTALADESALGYRRLAVKDVRVVAGAGIAGHVDGRAVVIGSAEWLLRNGVALADWPDADGAPGRYPDRGAEPGRASQASVVHCAIDGVQVLRLVIDDRLRADAAESVQRLRDDGLRVTLLTGDRRAAAERIAAELGGIEVIAEVLPEDKDRVIGELQRGGHRVAMVGDGINDAPALVRADVGIAVGSGTDVSIASADIVLMSNELGRVHDAALLSRRTLRAIRQNIGLSFAYNTIMVPLAMAAMITPLVAAVSMPLSSLAVIGNSARIRTLFRKRPSRRSSAGTG
jgi:Cu2+-exporting ATPase